jgi:hypothetical protein
MNHYEKRVAQQQREQEQAAEEVRIQRVGSHIVRGIEVKGDCKMDRHEDLVYAAFRGFDMSDYEGAGLYIFVPSQQQFHAGFDPNFYKFADYRD